MISAVVERDTIRLGEHQHVRQPTCEPSAADLDLADRLTGRHGEPKLLVRWLSTGEVEIQASSWVGVVEFSGLTVHVEPKLAGGSLRVLRMIEYASGVGMLRRLPSDRELAADGSDLFDLICLLLSLEAENLVRLGLLRDYRIVDERLQVLRGRLRHRDQLLKRFGQLDSLECTFDEFDTDTVHNQLVGAAVTVAGTRATDVGIRRELGKLRRVFDQVCRPTTHDPEWFERAIVYDRRTDRYRSAHLLSKLVLRSLAFNDLYDTSGGKVTAFLLDMNVVFERFVERLVREALAPTPLSVEAQQRVRGSIVNDDTGRTYSRIRPDLVVHDADHAVVVPIDVKYKTYDLKKVSTGDIYQAFLYAYALAPKDAEPRSGLIYPSIGTAGGHRLSIRPAVGPVGARIIGAGIDLPGVLDRLDPSTRPELLQEVRGLVGSLVHGHVA